MGRGLNNLLATVLVSMALLPMVAAQPNVCGPLYITFAPGTGSAPVMQGGSSYRINISIQDNNTQADTQPLAQTRVVQMTYGDSGAAGWQRTPPNEQITLTGGQGTGSFTVTAPSDADAVKNPAFPISGVMTCTSASGAVGTPSASNQLTFRPVLNATGGPLPDGDGVEPEPTGSSSALLITVIGVAIIAGAGYLVLTTKPVGVRLRATEAQKELAPGRGVSFPVVLQNRSDRPDTAVFNVAEVPAGWSAFMALGEIAIGPKEEKNLWLMVKAPPDAKEGESVKVTLEAKSKSTPGKTNRVELVAKVARPPAAVTGQESGTR